MRENNFSIPNANKASVGITPALYDRRALDCTSTLPLINSLNNLAYLTTSSARIRDILTVDGGVERLVCILKEGRSKDAMEMWKWNLAFQCVVNIGVRGSEAVRTRVVEADMVPVVATILDNYIQAIEKCREKEMAQYPTRQRSSSQTRRSHTKPHSRRQQPPPIEIPQQPATQVHEHRRQLSTPQNETVFTSSPFGNNISGFGIRPVQDIDRLPSMLPTLNTIELSSQPVSPSTPSAARTQETVPRRPSIRHQLSVSGPNWEDEQVEESLPETSDNNTASPDPVVGIQNDVVMQDADEAIPRGGSATPVTLTAPTISVVDEFNSHIDDSRTTTPTQQNFNPIQPLPPVNVVNATPPNVRQTLDSYYGRLPALPNLLSALPRDEDVIMSLQLLAYVSKYCNLRSYFQATHLVPRLKVGPELSALDSTDPNAGRTAAQLQADWDNEFVDSGEEAYNIFPLIEKFTVRVPSSSRNPLHPTSPQQCDTMQYWAGVVMRNLCRKDESRGGIRQCAYWKCGKWEQWPRQFAKCRRCRRTKYCSKDCQKGAWGTHRFWCVAAEEARDGEGSGRHHHHGHHHHRRREERSGREGERSGEHGSHSLSNSQSRS
ncbi:MYND-type zinc finger protein samB [Elsinoe australis]|uniref:MYND-type zinc finger protein samB n=1 Tax=Elsinoe australis TaxID=40998 RepID=A0A4U7B186_9PEZI|nr:MYND-type zinc finger protein samB [Elsinoe australis]